MPRSRSGGRATSTTEQHFDPQIVNPLQEFVGLDNFGQRTRWTWDGYVRNADGSPRDNNAGYCGEATFNPDRCGDPVFEIHGVRDVMGRLRSVTSTSGYPVFDLATYAPLPNPHQSDWRGYTYDGAGFFTREWTGAFADPPTVSLSPNSISNAAVDALGNTLGAEPWGPHPRAERHRIFPVRSGRSPRSWKNPVARTRNAPCAFRSQRGWARGDRERQHRRGNLVDADASSITGTASFGLR